MRLIRITRREGELLPLTLEWYAGSRYRHLPFSQKKFWAQLDAVLARGERGARFAAVRGEKVLGLINIAIGEPWLSEGGQHATRFAWLIAPALRGSFLGSRVALRLLETAKRWLGGAACGYALHSRNGGTRATTSRAWVALGVQGDG